MMLSLYLLLLIVISSVEGKCIVFSVIVNKFFFFLFGVDSEYV